MVAKGKADEILSKCRDATSQAVEKATVVKKSASSGISSAISDMRDKPASGPDPGGNKTGSFDGNSQAPKETGECLLPGELVLSTSGGAEDREERRADDTGEEEIRHSTDEIINGCGRNIADCFKSGLRDKKLLTIAGAMGIVWLIISLLPAIGINPLPVQFLSFLTFAQGGLTGGGLGFIGGIIGKGLIAYFVTLVIAGRITSKSTVSSLRSFKANISGKKWDSVSIAPLLIGVGSALVIYNFLAGTSSVFNCMVGVVAFIVAARSLSSGKGCIRKIFASLFAKDGRADTGFVTKIMAGWAAGFGLGAVLSLLGGILGGYICYIAGVVILLAGAGLVYSSGRKEGASA
ncbi:hypothetical protein [Methanolacinia paynteri]|uniref:hypothetical protein n=1 Tax=Methanolacinia paynteri TaxID=230356 RepID=UPI00064F89C1|nr:hypothetical protein [Methanolacinia paynteri]